MKRSLLLSLLVASGVLLLIVGGCEALLYAAHSGWFRPAAPADERPELEQRIDSLVASGATTIDFAAETDLPWDRMFVLGPYTDEARAERTLGHRWPHYDGTGLESTDMISVVVFQKDGRVVGWYAQGREVDVEPLARRTSGYSRSEARFAVVRARGRGAALRPF